MKKIKGLAGLVSTVALAAPMAALAQFAPPAGSGLNQTPIFNLINNLMLWILAIIGFISIIGFAIAGILYLTSGGDETRIETAKKAMMYSIIGVLVALVGLVIVVAVQSFFGASTRF